MAWKYWQYIVHFVGTLFSISIFSDLMKLDDTIVGIISCTSKILASFIFAFARTTTAIYLGMYIVICGTHRYLLIILMRYFNHMEGNYGLVWTSFAKMQGWIPLEWVYSIILIISWFHDPVKKLTKTFDDCNNSQQIMVVDCTWVDGIELCEQLSNIFFYVLSNLIFTFKIKVSILFDGKFMFYLSTFLNHCRTSSGDLQRDFVHRHEVYCF